MPALKEGVWENGASMIFNRREHRGVAKDAESWNVRGLVDEFVNRDASTALGDVKFVKQDASKYTGVERKRRCEREVYTYSTELVKRSRELVK